MKSHIVLFIKLFLMHTNNMSSQMFFPFGTIFAMRALERWFLVTLPPRQQIYCSISIHWFVIIEFTAFPTFCDRQVIPSIYTYDRNYMQICDHHWDHITSWQHSVSLHSHTDRLSRTNRLSLTRITDYLKVEKNFVLDSFIVNREF